MAGRFDVVATFKARDGVTKPVRKMSESVGKFTSSAQRGFSRLSAASSRLGSQMRAGATVGIGALTTFGFAMADVIRTGATFDRALGNAAIKFQAMGTNMDRAGENYRKLRQTAIDVGKTTEFTASQAANGLNFLARAGFDATTSMGSLRDMVDFALANEMTDLARATDIVSDTMGAFNMSTGTSEEKMANLNRVAKAMTVITNRTNTNVEQLFESVKKGGPIFAAAGFDIEKYAAMVGFAAQAGIKGGESGISMKNIILALSGVGNKAADTLKELGVAMTFKDKNGKDVLRDPLDTLDDLKLKLKSFGTGDVPPILQAIFGKIPIAMASNLVTDAADAIRQYEKVIRDSPDSIVSDNAAFIAGDTMGKIKGMTSAFESFKLLIFEGTKGGFNRVFARITTFLRSDKAVELAERISDAILEILDNLPEIFEWFKKIGIAAGIFVAISQSLQLITNLFMLLNAMVFLTPAGWMVLGIIAFVGAIALAVANVDKFVDSFHRLPAGLRPVVAIFNTILSVWKLIFDIVMSIFGKGSVSSAIDSFMGRMSNIGKGLFGEAPNQVDSNSPNLVTAGDNVMSELLARAQGNGTAEITLRAGMGTTAELTKGGLAESVKLVSSGGFDGPVDPMTAAIMGG